MDHLAACSAEAYCLYFIIYTQKRQFSLSFLFAVKYYFTLISKYFIMLYIIYLIHSELNTLL